MSKKKTPDPRPEISERNRTKKVILSLVQGRQNEPEDAPAHVIRGAREELALEEVFTAEDISEEHFVEGQIIVDKGDFYLVQEDSDTFTCKERGPRRDRTHAIFHTLDDGVFHMDDEH